MITAWHTGGHEEECKSNHPASKVFQNGQICFLNKWNMYSKCIFSLLLVFSEYLKGFVLTTALLEMTYSKYFRNLRHFSHNQSVTLVSQVVAFERSLNWACRILDSRFDIVLSQLCHLRQELSLFQLNNLSLAKGGWSKWLLQQLECCYLEFV